jgi:hypothetical protein
MNNSKEKAGSPSAGHWEERFERLEQRLDAMEELLREIYERQEEMAQMIALQTLSEMEGLAEEVAAYVEANEPKRRPAKKKTQRVWVHKDYKYEPKTQRPAADEDSLANDEKALAERLLSRVSFDADRLKKLKTPGERSLWVLRACRAEAPEGVPASVISFLLSKVAGLRHPTNGVAASLAKARDKDLCFKDPRNRWRLDPNALPALEKLLDA